MICTKVVIIRGLFTLFAEYFRRIADLFAEFALFVFSSIFILIPTLCHPEQCEGSDNINQSNNPSYY